MNDREREIDMQMKHDFIAQWFRFLLGWESLKFTV